MRVRIDEVLKAKYLEDVRKANARRDLLEAIEAEVSKHPIRSYIVVELTPEETELAGGRIASVGSARVFSLKDGSSVRLADTREALDAPAK